MSTFQVRVEDYVGTVSDTTSLTDQLTAGAKYLVDIIPEEKALKHTTTVTDLGTLGISVAAHRVFSAYKSGYRAIPLHPDEYARYVDSSSRFFGTSTTPVYYILNGMLFVKPGGGTGRVIAYPTVLYSESTITGFPTEWEYAVIIHTAIQQALNKANVNIASLNALSIAAVTPPTTPAAPSFSYTDAILGTYTATTVGDLGTAPAYTKPTTTVSFTAYDGYLVTNKDIELSAEERARQSILLNQYQIDIQNELNEFNKDLQIYQSTVQKALTDAQLAQQRILQTASDTKDLNLQNEAQTLVEEVQEYQAVLGKFQSDLQSYGAQVNTEVQSFGAKTQRTNSEILSNFKLVEELRIEFKNILITIGVK